MGKGMPLYDPSKRDEIEEDKPKYHRRIKKNMEEEEEKNK